MKNYLFTRNYIKQIFADDPTEPTKEQQSTEQSTESQEGKTKEADPPKPDDKGGEKKYTDADIDKIVNTRLARETVLEIDGYALDITQIINLAPRWTIVQCKRYGA